MIFCFYIKQRNKMTSKNIVRICRTQCRRAQVRFSQDIESYRDLQRQHAWCAHYCRTNCTRENVELCITESESFCKKYCHNVCFHTKKPVPIRVNLRPEPTTNVISYSDYIVMVASPIPISSVKDVVYDKYYEDMVLNKMSHQ